MTDWRPASYPVLIGHTDADATRETVDGHTWQTWGVHETACRRGGNCQHWIVTHLPSGKAVGVFYADGFARGYAEEIDALWTGWAGARGIGDVPVRVMRRAVRVRVLWGGG